MMSKTPPRRQRFAVLITLMILVPLMQAYQQEQGTLTINRDYGSIHAVAVPQEFDISLPTTMTHVVYPEQIGDKDAYVKLQFLNSENGITENLILKYIKVPLVEVGQREMLLKKKLIDLVNQYPQATVISSRTEKIASYHSVVIHAQNGNYFLSLFGILNPESQHCIAGIINIDPQISEIRRIDDLEDKKQGRARKVLESLKFGRELM
ncbi:MAG: hypothetical protein HQM16_10485 [Deltaproteobacteria bacterium]|nr:hypothetical protein [Deltaproteobacteria bacterium]